MSQDRLVEREAALRSWFTRNCDPVRAEIDGLDIGWGGVQRWITSVLPLETCRRHLDFACGYATFVAQLAWRFPQLKIVGLNIDFEGPHALAQELATQAGVADRCEFVRADAREMPLPTESFDSASCFLGLQDIEIGFGEEGVRDVLAEAVRILKRGGILAVADEFPIERLRRLLGRLPVNALRFDERALDLRWNRDVAEQAIALYANGWEAQARSNYPNARAEARAETLARMREEVERQLTGRGFYVPFGPIRLVIARKTRG
jgi:ubiquinone/menaquinone biosynthesis C-methylase UbiE